MLAHYLSDRALMEYFSGKSRDDLDDVVIGEFIQNSLHKVVTRNGIAFIPDQEDEVKSADDLRPGIEVKVGQLVAENDIYIRNGAQAEIIRENMADLENNGEDGFNYFSGHVHTISYPKSEEELGKKYSFKPSPGDLSRAVYSQSANLQTSDQDKRIGIESVFKWSPSGRIEGSRHLDMLKFEKPEYDDLREIFLDALDEFDKYEDSKSRIKVYAVLEKLEKAQILLSELPTQYFDFTGRNPKKLTHLAVPTPLAFKSPEKGILRSFIHVRGLEKIYMARNLFTKEDGIVIISPFRNGSFQGGHDVYIPKTSLSTPKDKNLIVPEGPLGAARIVQIRNKDTIGQVLGETASSLVTQDGRMFEVFALGIGSKKLTEYDLNEKQPGIFSRVKKLFTLV